MDFINRHYPCSFAKINSIDGGQKGISTVTGE